MYPEVYNENVYGKAAMTACSYGGKLYGYPVSFNTSFLVYNKKYAEAVDTIDQIRDISDNYQITDENQWCLNGILIQCSLIMQQQEPILI